jgi:light-harvesting complex I chlorophyll a/b binding protein 1
VCACADAKSLPGISQPFPNIFDPAALLARAASSRQPIRELRRWREAEITHGRVAMLASLGFIVQEQLEDFPLFYNIDGHITGEHSCELCFAFLSIDAISIGAT